jgi:thiol-disulfide isomerase/thioredoxin
MVFWIIAVALIFFLFFTSAGNSFRSWMMSFTLRSPDVESSKVEKLDEQFISNDWMVISDESKEVWISEIDKPIFLNIWATWCGPCRSEMSSIVELQNEMGDKVEFLLVSPTEGVEKIREYRLAKEIDFSLYVNGSQVPKKLHSTTFPTTFIIDVNKHIVHKWVGAYNWNNDEVKALLNSLAD